MTFYESDKEIRDTGAEVAEFDDAPPRHDPEGDEPDITEKDTEPD